MEDDDAAAPLLLPLPAATGLASEVKTPKRKPGPVPRSGAALSSEVAALRRQNRLLEAQLADLQTLRPVLALQRQRFAFTDVGRLRTALRGSDPAQDEPALREELRLLRAEIGERHEYWPES